MTSNNTGHTAHTETAENRLLRPLFNDVPEQDDVAVEDFNDPVHGPALVGQRANDIAFDLAHAWGIPDSDFEAVAAANVQQGLERRGRDRAAEFVCGHRVLIGRLWMRAADEAAFQSMVGNAHNIWVELGYPVGPTVAA